MYYLQSGPYPLVWVSLEMIHERAPYLQVSKTIMAIYEHPSNAHSRPVSISSSMIKTPLTGVDANTSFTLTFPSAQAILSTNINLTSPFGCIIRYEHGSIVVAPPIYCPKQFTVQYHDSAHKVVREETRTFDYVGGGWHFQADEVARCVKDGKRESEVWSHEKTLLEMEVLDRVRRDGDYVLPPGVEKVVS